MSMSGCSLPLDLDNLLWGTTIVSGRLLGEETPVETELTHEGDDFEFVAELPRVVPPPPRVRSQRSYAPILPPARRRLATTS
jgi:hypothetical protein